MTKPATPAPELKTTAQVREYIEAAMAKAADGKIPVQTAQSISALAKAALAAIEAERKEKRQEKPEVPS